MVTSGGERGEALRGRINAPIAWCVWAVSAACAAFGLLFMYLNVSLAPFFGESLGVDAAVAVTYPAVGAVIVSRRPENTVGWLFCIVGLLLGLTVFCGEYAKYALLTQPGALSAGVAAAWVATWAWVPGAALNVTFLLLLFPDGRLPSPRWWPVAWVAGGLTVLGSFVIAVLPWDELNFGVPAGNPFEIPGILAFEDEIRALVIVLGAVAVLLSILSLIVRFRRTWGVERQQIKWFAYAGGLFALTVLVPIPAVANLQALTVTFLPVAVCVAILRYGLYDIDVLINRTLVYGALTVSLALVYFGSVATLQYAFRALTGGGSQLVIVASTLTIAALFGPLRRRIQALIDRRFYRRKYDAARTLETFSAKLRDETDLDRLGGELVRVVHGTMQPAHASVWLPPSTKGARR